MRWNDVKQISENTATRVRSGIVDIDQSRLGNFIKSENRPWATPLFGRIADAQGSANPGIREWNSQYNQFYANTVRGVRQNEVLAFYPGSARPDLTDIWTCYDLDGQFIRSHSS